MCNLATVTHEFVQKAKDNAKNHWLDCVCDELYDLGAWSVDLEDWRLAIVHGDKYSDGETSKVGVSIDGETLKIHGGPTIPTASAKYAAHEIAKFISMVEWV